MKKRIIWCLVLLVLVALYMNRSDFEYRPVGDDHKWVCSKPEGWLLKKDGRLVGQLTLGDEIKNIKFDWGNGHPGFPFAEQFGMSVFVYEYFPSEGEKAPDEVLLFRGRGYFHKKSFRVAVSQEYVDVIGYRNLKFRQVELDEADRAFQAADTKPLNSTEDDFTQQEHIDKFEMAQQEYHKPLQAIQENSLTTKWSNRSEDHMEKTKMRKVRLTITESRCRSGYFEKGQEFVVEDLCPPLCHELWNNIYPLVYALQNGAELDYGDVRAKMFDAKCPDECRVHIHGEIIDA